MSYGALLRLCCCVLAVFVVGVGPVAANATGIEVAYDDGLEITTQDGNNRFHIDWRAQLRFEDLAAGSHPDGVIENTDEFSINRARFKMGGHVYRPWLKFYTEYDLEGGRLLDLRFEMARNPKAVLRVGQYKVLYNRERVDSSGKQQFVERSIATRTFTLDRQQGLTLRGRLFEGRRADSRYAVGVFTGTGRAGDGDSDDHPLYTARWQWNFLRRDLGFSQSDIRRREKAAASIAVAAASNRSQFTRFSSSGGGQLDGFDGVEPGRYDIEQTMIEFALQSRGLSIQAELHGKDIEDRIVDSTTELSGYYAQVGYFPSEVCESFPKPLELAARYARVRRESDRLRSGDESTLAANWFFHGHRNKLTADVSYLQNFADDPDEVTEWRARLQWDVSF